ncbi:MAG: hypothetical protein OEM82_05905 [Acidobacteriota bacterium]|nr:hypothetical protein [Acidobacteriota bacterium]MDH3529080.1 hypothetical protein [Acidobacteriota bacterium]
MNRFVIGIITFFLTFGISTSLVGLLFGFPEVGRSYSASSHAARNIQRVLDADVRNGESRRLSEVKLYRLMKRMTKHGKMPAVDGEEFVNRHQSIISAYTDKSSSIDVSHTPADFQYAWKKHMDAWSAEVESTRNRSFGDVFGAKDEPSEINATWMQVLRIAKRYGVPIRSRYMR